MIDSFPTLHVRWGTSLELLEWFFTLAFTLEYIARLSCVQKPRAYARSALGIIDLVAVLPTWAALFLPGLHALIDVRVLRLLRLFRILKLAAYVDEFRALASALTASGRKILVFLSFVLVVVVVMGTIMYVVEGPENGFANVPVSVYWAISTMTTVGFGDITPKTGLGRFIASLMMLVGWGTLAVPTGIVSAEFTALRVRGISRERSCSRVRIDRPRAARALLLRLRRTLFAFDIDRVAELVACGSRRLRARHRCAPASSAETNARSSSWWLVPGSCVPLTIASTTARRVAAPSRLSATPAPASSPPGCVAACSSARATVVPSATTRPPRCSRRANRGDGAGRNAVRLVERQARIERGVAGRRQAGGVGQRREADAASRQTIEQLPVEDESGRRRLERDRQRGDPRPDVPERKRRGEMRVLHRTAVACDAGADRVRVAGEAQLDEARMVEQADDGGARAVRARAHRRARAAAAADDRSVGVRWSPAPKTTATNARTSSAASERAAGEADLDRRAARDVAAGEARGQGRGVVGDDAGRRPRAPRRARGADDGRCRPAASTTSRRASRGRCTGQRRGLHGALSRERRWRARDRSARRSRVPRRAAASASPDRRRAAPPRAAACPCRRDRRR